MNGPRDGTGMSPAATVRRVVPGAGEEERPAQEPGDGDVTRVMTLSEAAEHLGLADRTLWRWRDAKKISTTYDPHRNRWYVDLDAIPDDLIAKSRRRSKGRWGQKDDPDALRRKVAQLEREIDDYRRQISILIMELGRDRGALEQGAGGPVPDPSARGPKREPNAPDIRTPYGDIELKHTGRRPARGRRVSDTPAD